LNDNDDKDEVDELYVVPDHLKVCGWKLCDSLLEVRLFALLWDCNDVVLYCLFVGEEEELGRELHPVDHWHRRSSAAHRVCACTPFVHLYLEYNLLWFI
jgi:hypothetical protein